MESQQLLEINPSNSIKFEGTFKEVITKKLLIKNPLDKNVAFKIKTTTPKQYCVRPSIGFVSPQQTKEISIILQPMQYTITEKARHKFMIQSLIISEEESANIDLVWKNAAAGDIMCTKLLSVLVQTPEPAIEPETVAKESDTVSAADVISTTTTTTETSAANIDTSTGGTTATESSVSERRRVAQPLIDRIQLDSPLNGVSLLGDMSMLESIDSSPDDGVSVQKLSDDNAKLKDQVAVLKKLVFDQTYKLESMQTETNFDKDKLVKDEPPLGAPMPNSQLGLPLIIYQLLAFFLGLVIGKFFL